VTSFSLAFGRSEILGDESERVQALLDGSESLSELGELLRK